MIVCVFVGVQRHIKQYFSYTVAASFIGGGNGYTRKTTELPHVTDKFITLCCIEYTSP
jgi:hypothetical protein